MPVFILLAALYTGWTFYSRRQNAAVEFRRAAEAREIERSRKDVELNGGSQLKITMLYASAAAVRRGQTAQICYGVVNAKNISFVPTNPGRLAFDEPLRGCLSEKEYDLYTARGRRGRPLGQSPDFWYR